MSAFTHHIPWVAQGLVYIFAQQIFVGVNGVGEERKDSQGVFKPDRRETGSVNNVKQQEVLSRYEKCL